MAQSLKVIDLNRSYVPIDPRSFPESMHSTQQEDAPEGRIPVVPYDGYNFMPAAYGYMSYFGINSVLGVNALTELISPFDLLNVDDLFIVQTPDLQNIMVALCEDGIYTKYAASSGAWDKVIDFTASPAILPDEGQHYNYTKCVIGNEVYVYRAGSPVIWVMRDDEDFVPTELYPSTNMNMEAQQGIFKAGGRLGMWDSANSIAWSDVDNKMDFIPDLETGAGATIFQQIVGRIVNCIQHGNGFVIYCTRAIVHVRRTADANFFWNSETIFNDNGISYLNEVTQGQPDTTHFAYTTFGIVKIENGQSEYIIPEIFTYLKESRDPVYLRLLEGRYLFFQFLNDRYLLGIPNFSYEVVPGSTLTFKGASYAVTHIEDNPCKAIKAAETQHEAIFLYDNYGYNSNSEAIAPGIVPIWEDHIASSIDMEKLVSWAESGEFNSPGSVAWFSSVPFSQGGIAKITGGTEYFLPASAYSLPESDGYTAQEHIQDNELKFFSEQDMVWVYEQNFDTQWKRAIKDTVHNPITQTNVYVSANYPQRNKHTFGPFVDLSYFSEANKVYGIAEKSAWLQRSLTRLVYVEVEETLTLENVQVLTFDSISSPVFVPPITEPVTVADVFPSGDGPYYEHNVFEGRETGACTRYAGSAFNVNGPGVLLVKYASATPPPNWGVECTNIIYKPFAGATDVSGASGFVGIDPTLDHPVPDVYADLTQSFSTPVFRYVDIDTCVLKNLGYTQIKGHGHYDLLGNFIVDDATPDTADYIDACDDDPNKTKTLITFNGVPVPDLTGCEAGDPIILSYTFSHPDETIVIPPSRFLMQDGSIEPIYPTFQGAFVFDLQYKKWGKCGQPHKLLLNYSPVNSQAGDKPVPADIFNVNAGCLLEDGTIALFDKYPENSIIKWGKIGYFRKGFTNCEEVRLQFRGPATGTITVEGSLDGKNIEPAISQLRSYENVNEYVAYFSNSARWYNVVVTGIFDIKDIDFNGHKQGKR